MLCCSVRFPFSVSSRLPFFETVCDAEISNAVLSYEAMHWTKHSSWLSREFGREE
jgi:hypothetical protein